MVQVMNIFAPFPPSSFLFKIYMIKHSLRQINNFITQHLHIWNLRVFETFCKMFRLDSGRYRENKLTTNITQLISYKYIYVHVSSFKSSC
jgi:hypothetical protein